MANEDRWRRLNAIWESAMKVEPGRREEFVREACGDDEGLRAEVESLLRHDENAGDFLEPPEVRPAPSLTGRRLGHYEVLDKLGEGGMGIVFKARDTHLDRLAALKTLRPEWVIDPSRKARFVREAKAASALNHPNIVHIYDISTDAGVDFIAMEFVEGKTLGELIPHDGMGVNDALKTGMQIAEALMQAHAAGIIHRDLKPANVMTDANGLVKVLDFGVAKLTERCNWGEMATASEGTWTEEGALVGTASYMSPEQVAGKPLDGRSDIFSFGAVLYEMVTGRRAFQGDSAMATLSAVLEREPAPVPAGTPLGVAELIKRCLRKDPSQRYQTAAELKLALAKLSREPHGGGTEEAAPSDKRTSRRRLAAALGSTVALAGVIALTWPSWRHPSPEEPGSLKILPLTAYEGHEISPTFSPDGSQFAFSWDGERQDNYDIYVRLVGGGTPVRLTKAPSTDASPAWSPDGRWIAFQRDGGEPGIYLVSPLGGPERRLTTGGSTMPCWTPDATSVVYSHADAGKETNSLWTISIASGERRRLTFPPEDQYGDVGCAVSPDGTKVVFGRWVMPAFGAGIWMLPIKGGEARRLTGANFGAQVFSWMASGDEVVFGSSRVRVATSAWFFGEGSLWRLRVPATGEGEPRRVGGVDQVSAWPAVSRGGSGRPARLAYARFEWDTNIWRLDITGSGTRRRPSPVCSSTRGDLYPAISPDGRRMIFASHRSGATQLWSCDGENSDAAQLTNELGVIGTPSWSPDGRKIALDILDHGNRDIYIMNPDGTGLHRMTTEPANDGRATWSSDGRWIYFHSARTGTHEIWKMPTEGGPAIQLTRRGGSEPREWNKGGPVYYVKSISEGGLWEVPVDGGEEKEVFGGIRRGEWNVGPEGIYFLGEAVEGTKRTIELLDPSTGRLRRLGFTQDAALLRDVSRLSVSPDGRWLAVVQFDRFSTDLMLVESFR